jgi:hypothetical protein
MLRAGRDRVNASSFNNWRHFALGVLSNDMRFLEKLLIRSKILLSRAAQVHSQAPRAQMCFGYAQCDSAIHLEFQRPETRRRAAVLEISLRMRALAIQAISDDAAPEQRSQQKMFFLKKARQMHHLAPRRRLRFYSGVQFPPQKYGYTRGSSLASRVFATLPLPRPAPRQFPERALPILCRTKATEALASGSSLAKATKRKTSSRTDSTQHIPSSARERLSQVSTGQASFSELDYRSIPRIRRSEEANWSAL